MSCNGDDGLVVNNGVIVFDEEAKVKDSYVFVMVDALVGVAKVVKDKEESNGASSLSVGFDSLLLQDAEEEENQWSGTSSSANAAASSKPYRYKVFDEKSLRPRYVTRFILEECNNYDDDNSKDLDVYDRKDFFDLEQWSTVSLRDKMLQNNLAPANRRDSNLVSVEEAYEKTVSVSAFTDPKTLKAKNMLKGTLTSVDDKVRLVNLGYAAGEEKIFQAAKDAMVQLKLERERKINFLMAAEAELKRKLHEIEFFESHLVKQRQAAPQVDYLRIWKSHTELRSDFFGDPNNPKGAINNELKLLESVSPDIVVEGSLVIMSHDKIGGEDSRGPPQSAHDGDAAASGGAAKELTSGNDSPRFDGTGDRFFDGASHPSSYNGAAGAHDSSLTASIMVPGMYKQQGVSTLAKPKRGQGFITRNDDFTEAKPPLPHSWLKPSPRPVVAGEVAKGESNGVARVADNLVVAEKAKRFRLSTMSERKQRIKANKVEGDQMFAQSKILATEEEARSLYFSLPGDTKSMFTRVLFQGGAAAITDDLLEPTIYDFHEKLMLTKAPTVIILKSGDHVYGGYADVPWGRDVKEEKKTTAWNGAPKSFLFSITCDTKIPFVGRNLDPMKLQQAWRSRRRKRVHDGVFSGNNFISFGVNDLVIRDDLTRCSSRIEESYGVGLNEQEAKTFLAGAENFSIDAIEIFEILNVK